MDPLDAMPPLEYTTHSFDPISASTLDPQDAFLMYPSPISPPAGFFHQQYSDHIPTPPTDGPSPTSPMTPGNISDENAVVSVSTSFHPGVHAVEPDTIFASSDNVLFYAHSQVLRAVSPNAFRRVVGVLCRSQDKGGSAKLTPGSNQAEEVIHIPDTSAVLNVILHMLYGTSAAQNSPSFDTLATAVDRMPFYDLEPRDYITPRTPIYQLLLTHAPLFPLQLYTLAGHHDLRDLAVATSSHLLSYTLSNIPEELAERMGAVYLKRLLCLHLDRFNALKQILLAPPYPHPPTRECSFLEQKKLTRAWALVSAYLAWDARPACEMHFSLLQRT